MAHDDAVSDLVAMEVSEYEGDAVDDTDWLGLPLADVVLDSLRLYLPL